MVGKWCVVLFMMTNTLAYQSMARMAVLSAMRATPKVIWLAFIWTWPTPTTKQPWLNWGRMMNEINTALQWALNNDKGLKAMGASMDSLTPTFTLIIKTAKKCLLRCDLTKTARNGLSRFITMANSTDWASQNSIKNPFICQSLWLIRCIWLRGKSAFTPYWILA